MQQYNNIIILTGAGLSAESGLDTFRDKDGIWSKYDLNDVATPEGFAKNPALVHRFYNKRRSELLGAKPNAAHHALAKLESEHAGTVLTVTQNIDHLHEAAGSKNVIHMHGELLKIFCIRCDAHFDWRDDLSTDTQCQNCGATGSLRPDVVWFGEVPYRMDEIISSLMDSDLFISIGTSGNVYPASGFVAGAKDAGARCVELNLEPSEGISYFDEAIHGPATEIVPRFVDELVGKKV